LDTLNKKGVQGDKIFWISVAFTAVFSVWSLIDPIGLTSTLWAWVYDFHGVFSWFTIVMPFTFLVICIFFAFSRFGKYKFGGKDATPEFSTFSWMGMLFAAGIGVGLMNFGVAEPLSHFLTSPLGLPGGHSPEAAAQNALNMTMFIWGLPAWSIYTISALVIGYFTYSRGSKFLPGTPIEEGFKDKKWNKALGNITNISAAGAAALTMAATIGLGVFQIQNGLNAVLGIQFDEGLFASVLVLIFVFLTFALPATLPLAKGMKRAGDLNVVIAILILAFVFLAGPTSYFMNTIIGTLGGTFSQVIPISFNAFPLVEKGWFNDWPLTTMIWWVSWTPFVGVFVARISKGRTIKEFVLASIFIPTVFLVFWFSIFGGFGLKDTILGDGAIARFILDNPDDVYLSFIMVLQAMPFFQITGPLFIFLIIVFLATGACSAAISLSMITSNGSSNAPPRKTLIWSVIMVTVAFATIATGTISGVRAIAVFLGIPYTFFLIMQISGFIRSIRADYKKGVLK
jgi:choline-glycine betaine transporter